MHIYCLRERGWCQRTHQKDNHTQIPLGASLGPSWSSTLRMSSRNWFTKEVALQPHLPAHWPRPGILQIWFGKDTTSVSASVTGSSGRNIFSLNFPRPHRVPLFSLTPIPVCCLHLMSFGNCSLYCLICISHSGGLLAWCFGFFCF